MRSGRVSVSVVFVVFVVNGLVAGSWAPRMPVLAERIEAGPGALGLALIGANIGLAVTASAAGRLTARYGAPAMVLSAVVLAAAVLPLLALVGSPVQLGAVLVLLGASFGLFDVSMNIAAVTVIRALDRPLMPVFHAGFSFGALTGSLGAAFASHLDVGLLPYFLSASVVTLAVIAPLIRSVPRERPGSAREVPGGAMGRGVLRRPMLWLLGGLAFLCAVAEGSNYDWSALFAVRERGMSESGGALMFAVFCLSMALVRLMGERIQRRLGPVRVLAGGSLMAGAGLLTAASVPALWATYAGYVLAGCGVALIFPVVLSMAGEAGRRADGSGGEREIAFVTGIAYTGFLLGPPMVGGIAQLTGLTFAIGFVGAVAMLIAPLALVSAAAQRREARAGRAVRSRVGP